LEWITGQHCSEEEEEQDREVEEKKCHIANILPTFLPPSHL
jgi:hypothetical protein